MTQHHITAGDARQESRSETLKGALIFAGKDKAGNEKPAQQCLITNLSPDGAEITLVSGVRVPPRFVLHVPHEEIAYRAEVRWREEGRVGVTFRGSEKKPRPVLKAVEG